MKTLLLLGFCVVTSILSSRLVHAQTNGKVAHWMADGDFKDSANGIHGTPYGGVSFATGVHKQAFQFDGATGRVFIPDNTALAITKSLCISAWVNPFSYTQGVIGLSQLVFRGDDRGAFDPYWLGITSKGILVFQVATVQNNSVTIQSPQAIPLNKNTFVAATLDDATGKMSLFVNGIQVAQTTTLIRPFATLNASRLPGLGIGNVQSRNYDEYFHGLIDDVKIYKVALPTAQPATISLDTVKVKGGTSVNAVLTLDDASIIPLSAVLKSTNTAATLPAKLAIPAGFYQGQFTITTSPVTTSTSGYIYAILNGIKIRIKLTVTP